LTFRIALLVLTVICAGCNPVARIAENANAIRAEAATLADHGRATNDQAVVRGAERIEDLAADIHTTLPDVEAKTPAWMSMIIYLSWAGIAIAVCVMLWQTGLGKAIRVMLGWIPAPVAQEAQLLRDAIDPNRKESMREFVAARRASSPLFELAWKRAQEQHTATKETANDAR
jgi:hypothetical protein